MARASTPLAWLLAAPLALASTTASAQLLSGGDEFDQEKVQENPRGAYTGVKPGGAEKPAVAATAGTVPTSITWPGFQMRLDGTSRVFVQTTASVAVGTEVSADKVVVDFGNANIVGATNRFPLITKYFNTPVTKVELKREQGSTRMVLHLRVAATPQVSSEPAPSGFFFVYVDFPAGDFKPAGMSAIAPAPKEAPKAEGAPPKAEAEPPAPEFLDSMDDELPPGMGKLKAKGKAKGSIKSKGKGKVKGKAKASGGIRLGS